MVYAEVELAARQTKTQRELCQVNENVEELFCQGKLYMTDENWVDFTKLIGEIHPTLPA